MPGAEGGGAGNWGPGLREEGITEKVSLNTAAHLMFSRAFSFAIAVSNRTVNLTEGIPYIR